jgi:alkylation response protein AidB-like acyl-CoA dehydrogenase
MKVLVSALLCGVGQRALDLAVAYTKDRQAFGVPIASFQVIAHGLADIATDLDGAKLLSWEAAWAHDELPRRAAELSSMAYLIAVETARSATEGSLHLFGGYGLMLEYDVHLEVAAVRTLGGERTNITTLTDVRVSDALRVGEVDGAWEVLGSALMFERASTWAPSARSGHKRRRRSRRGRRHRTRVPAQPGHDNLRGHKRDPTKHHRGARSRLAPQSCGLTQETCLTLTRFYKCTIIHVGHC